jgi:hypothetical protein
MLDQEESMKPVLVIPMAGVLLFGCIQRVERQADGFDRTKVIAACDHLINSFQETLKRELAAAMTEGGPEKAISVCNVRAPLIADSLSLLPGIDVKRVSLRQRNPYYKPDDFEVSVLTQFASAGTTEPQSYGVLTFDSANVKRFRYMKEIKVGQLCVNCHGDPKNFPPRLKAVLAAYYPNDKAAGYALGDSRGAFSVTVSYPEAKATITALLSEKGR